MKFTEIMVAWEPEATRIKVGPWPDRSGWSDDYLFTTGACYTDVRHMPPEILRARVLSDFVAVVGA